jgi:hypothetical protein
MKPFIAFVAFCLSVITVAVAQDSNLVKFKYGYERLNDQEVMLTIRAHVNNGGKLYSVNKIAEDALYSSVAFDSSVQTLLKGNVTEQGPVKKEKDASVGVDVQFTTDSLVWHQAKQILPSP